MCIFALYRRYTDSLLSHGASVKCIWSTEVVERTPSYEVLGHVPLPPMELAHVHPFGNVQSVPIYYIYVEISMISA